MEDLGPLKIALVGSAPASVGLAPFGDPSWRIWGCSPGVFPVARRVDAWFELHRWEPGVVGCPETQKPWFTPEYVAWMANQRLVWMYQPVREIPNSRALPIDNLSKLFGNAWWTSSLAYMMAMATKAILEVREARKAAGQDSAGTDCIGLWGVDMAASEEYGFQRAGCQYFALLADQLGINVIVPPESDLLRPMPQYGLMESTHWHIKNTARLRELTGRLNAARAAKAEAEKQELFLMGAIDDINYQMQTWCEDRVMTGPSAELLKHVPVVQAMAAGGAGVGFSAPDNLMTATEVLARQAPSRPDDENPHKIHYGGGDGGGKSFKLASTITSTGFVGKKLSKKLAKLKKSRITSRARSTSITL